MRYACKPNLVGVASPVLEILLPFVFIFANLIRYLLSLLSFFSPMELIPQSQNACSGTPQ